MEERMVSRSLVPWPLVPKSWSGGSKPPCLPAPGPLRPSKPTRPGSKGERCMIEASIKIGGSLPVSV